MCTIVNKAALWTMFLTKGVWSRVLSLSSTTQLVVHISIVTYSNFYFQHRFKLLTSQRIRSIMRCNDVDSIQRYDFPNILQERVPGTPGHQKVKEVSFINYYS